MKTFELVLLLNLLVLIQPPTRVAGYCFPASCSTSAPAKTSPSSVHPAHAFGKRSYTSAVETSRTSATPHGFILPKEYSYNLKLENWGSEAQEFNHPISKGQIQKDRQSSKPPPLSAVTILTENDHLGPGDREILKQHWKYLVRSKMLKRLDLSNNLASKFVNEITNNLIRAYREDNLDVWFQYWRSCYLLNTDFLVDLSKILKMEKSEPRFEPQMKDTVLNLIFKLRNKSRGRTLGPWNRLPLYKQIDSISPGIWTFTLPMTDLEMIKNNPVARLSWLLEDLNPSDMITYAEALQKALNFKPSKSISAHAMAQNQAVLERSDREPESRFSLATWFVTRMGWERFQDAMLAFEKNTMKKLSGKPKNIFQLNSADDLKLNELNNLLTEAGFSQLLAGYSPETVEWLTNFLRWLKESNIAVNLGPSWKL